MAKNEGTPMHSMLMIFAILIGMAIGYTMHAYTPPDVTTAQTEQGLRTFAAGYHACEKER
jgi:ABC-type molybdate transport system substrate-binding protein